MGTRSLQPKDTAGEHSSLAHNARNSSAEKMLGTGTEQRTDSKSYP
jgi:hypothetical protein